MRTITIHLYKYDELSEEARDKARRNTEYPYDYDNDMAESARKAREIYRALGRIEGTIEGARLYAWVQNNVIGDLTVARYYSLAGKRRISRLFRCVDAANLTGVCYDYAFLKPLEDFLKDPTGVTNHHLARTDVERIYQRLIQDETNYFYSDEGFSEYCACNDLEFLKDGLPAHEVFNDIITVA